MISFNFNKLLTPINIYRISLLILLIVSLVTAEHIKDIYSFIQAIVGMPIIIFMLTYPRLWIKNYDFKSKSKYDRTVSEIIFAKKKKGKIRTFFAWFFLCSTNFALIVTALSVNIPTQWIFNE